MAGVQLLSRRQVLASAAVTLAAASIGRSSAGPSAQDCALPAEQTALAKHPALAKLLDGHAEKDLFTATIEQLHLICGSSLQTTIETAGTQTRLHLSLPEGRVTLSRDSAGQFSSTSTFNSLAIHDDSRIKEFREKRQGFGLTAINGELENITRGASGQLGADWPRLFAAYALDQLAQKLVEPCGVPW